MSKMTRFLLVLSLSCLTAGLVFVTGIVNVGETVGLYVTLPAGAIFFGLFLISMSLQEASALFDKEQQMALAAAKAQPAAAPMSSCHQAKRQEKDAFALVH